MFLLASVLASAAWVLMLQLLASVLAKSPTTVAKVRLQQVWHQPVTVNSKTAVGVASASDHEQVRQQ